MASITSNSRDVSRVLGNLADTMNLRRRSPRGNNRLGDELINTAVTAIETRSVDQQAAPSGKGWAPLRARTIARKRRLGLDPRINIETHTMLSYEQIRGQTAVGKDYAVTIAGLDDETKAKVAFAQEGGPGRPARPFEDLGADGQAAVDNLIDEVIESAIAEASG
jgi:hypothetical protein